MLPPTSPSHSLGKSLLSGPEPSTPTPACLARSPISETIPTLTTTTALPSSWATLSLVAKEELVSTSIGSSLISTIKIVLISRFRGIYRNCQAHRHCQSDLYRKNSRRSFRKFAPLTVWPEVYIVSEAVWNGRRVGGNCLMGHDDFQTFYRIINGCLLM